MSVGVAPILLESNDYKTNYIILAVYKDDREVFEEYVGDSVRILSKKTRNITKCAIEEYWLGCYTDEIDGKRREIRYIKKYFLKNQPKFMSLYLCFREFGGVWIDIFRNILQYYLDYVNGQTYDELCADIKNDTHLTRRYERRIRPSDIQ